MFWYYIIIMKYNGRKPIMCICFMHIHKEISVLSWLDSKSVSLDMHIDFEDVVALSVKHSWFLSVLSLWLISHIMVWWPFNSCELDSLSLEQGRKNKTTKKRIQISWTSAVLKIALCMKFKGFLTPKAIFFLLCYFLAKEYRSRVVGVFLLFFCVFFF